MNSAQENLTISKYFGNIATAIKSTFKGMRITIGYVTKVPEVTLEYPEVKEVLPTTARMRLYNNVDDCTACGACANACPVNCIYIASIRRDKDAPPKKASDGTPIRLDLTQYVIDTALCCYCGICTTVCPTECLTHTSDYEFSQFTLEAMKYDYLSPDVRAWKQRLKGEAPLS